MVGAGARGENSPTPHPEEQTRLGLRLEGRGCRSAPMVEPAGIPRPSRRDAKPHRLPRGMRGRGLDPLHPTPVIPAAAQRRAGISPEKTEPAGQRSRVEPGMTERLRRREMVGAGGLRGKLPPHPEEQTRLGLRLEGRGCRSAPMVRPCCKSPRPSRRDAKPHVSLRDEGETTLKPLHPTPVIPAAAQRRAGISIRRRRNLPGRDPGSGPG